MLKKTLLIFCATHIVFTTHASEVLHPDFINSAQIKSLGKTKDTETSKQIKERSDSECCSTGILEKASLEKNKK